MRINIELGGPDLQEERSTAFARDVLRFNWPIHQRIVADTRFEAIQFFRLMSLFFYREFDEHVLDCYWEIFKEGTTRTPALTDQYSMDILLDMKKDAIRPNSQLPTDFDLAFFLIKMLRQGKNADEVIAMLQETESGKKSGIFEDLAWFLSEGDPIDPAAKLIEEPDTFRSLHFDRHELSRPLLLQRIQRDMLNLRQTAWVGQDQATLSRPIRLVSWLVQDSNQSKDRLLRMGVPIERAETYYFDTNKLAYDRGYARGFKPYPTIAGDVLRVGMANVVLYEQMMRNFVFDGMLPSVGAMVIQPEQFYLYNTTTGLTAST